MLTFTLPLSLTAEKCMRCKQVPVLIVYTDSDGSTVFIAKCSKCQLTTKAVNKHAELTKGATEAIADWNDLHTGR